MTPRPRHRVSEVIRRFYERFALRFPALDTPPIHDVLGDLTVCRTAALGEHFEQCDDCGFARVSYNSCRNRHCPSCQGSARSAWLARQEADVLPVSYFHVVFTLPEALRGLALQNKELDLRTAVLNRIRDAQRSGQESQTSGGRDRRSGGLAYLGPEPDAPPASALRDSGRRRRSEWVRLGPLQT